MGPAASSINQRLHPHGDTRARAPAEFVEQIDDVWTVFARKVHVRELNRNIIIIAYSKTFSVCVIIVAIL